MKKTPADLTNILARNAKARVKWNELTSIGRKDFISWIESAKQSETHTRRIESVPSRLASGKKRPCCYALVPMNLYKALDASPKAKAPWKTLTPNAKRDFTDWIEAAKDPDMSASRIQKTCTLLASGKRRS